MRGSDRPAPGERFFRIDTPASRRLADIASRHHDLKFAADCVRALDALVTADSHDFVQIQALWTAAVVAYARSFTSGRVRTLDDRDRARLIGDAGSLHEELMRRRNQHIAHQADSELENVTVAVGIRPTGARDVAVSNAKDLAPSPSNVATVGRYLREVLGRLAELASEAQSQLRGEITEELLQGAADVTAEFEDPDYGSEVDTQMGGFYRVLTPADRERNNSPR